ncbi:MAG: hypothetical protein KAR03_01010, partial [Candidatus Thorarchaeota archaeon]|nr:hypothetical protein [Candidatus Thorarchaeota archaeon]
MLLTMYALRIYRVPTWKLISQTFLISTSRTTVLESGDIDSRIWKLRGAFWFIVSVPLSIIIVAAVYQWNPTTMILLTIISLVVIIMVGYPSLKSYEDSVRIFSSLVEFHLFDRGLSIVRRWEASTMPIRDTPSFSMDGLTETIYRGIKAANEKDSDTVRKILRPTTYLTKGGGTERRESGIKIKQSSYQSEEQRYSDSARFHDMVNEEFEWLRELIRRQSWAAFRMRFSDLQTQIQGRGIKALNDVERDLIAEWANTLKTGGIIHSFTQLRALCNRLRKYQLIPDDKVAIVEKLLKYHESHMVNRSWAIYYWTDIIEKYQEVAIPIIHDAFQSIQGKWVEQDF